MSLSLGLIALPRNAAHADPVGFNATFSAAAFDAQLPGPTNGLGAGGILGALGLPTTNSLISAVTTTDLRPADPPTGAPHVRVMLISEGVEPNVLPPAVRSSIVGDLHDPHGYGTWVTSVLLQLLSNVEITSKSVGPGMANLGSILDAVAADPSRYDIVLLALHPAWLLEPSVAMASANVGTIGTDPLTGASVNGSRWDQLQEAIWKNPGIASTAGRVVGIPSDPALRERVFARSKGKERAAVEYAIARQASWDGIVAKIHTLFGEGVPVVMPAGDWPQGSPRPAVAGLAALPEVITIGAAYRSGATSLLSPISAVGTFSTTIKPDALVDTNVVGVLPLINNSTYGTFLQSLGLPDLATSVDFRAIAGCDYCDLYTGPSGNVVAPPPQGSSVVAAAVATARLGQLVAQGWPAPALTRMAGVTTRQDAAILRGLVWTDVDPNTRVFTGPDHPPLATELPPIPLARPDLGTVPWNTTRSVTVPMWTGGGVATSTVASTSLPAGVSGTVSLGAGTMTVGLTTTTNVGGIVAPKIVFSPRGSMYAEVALSLPVKISTGHPFITHGEQMEKATFALLPGLPEYVGPFNPVQVLLPPDLADMPVRIGVTGDTARHPGIAPGTAQIDDVVPGFYRLYLLDDHGAVARQAGEQPYEGLAPVLTGGGISGVYIPNFVPCADFPVANCSSETLPSATLGNPNALQFCDADYSVPGYIKTMHVYCGGASVPGPTGVITRNIYLPTWSQLTRCGVGIPRSTSTTLEALNTEIQQDDCGQQVNPNAQSAWSWSAHAADCGSGDALPDPTNPASDLATAVYQGAVPLAAPPGTTTVPSTLPITTLTYRFAVPQPASSLDATIDFAFHMTNAIAVLTLTAGDSAVDTVSAALVASDPNVHVDQTLAVKGSTGSVSWRAAVLTAGANQATLRITIIPTTWIADSPLAQSKFELCNLGIRAKTFARQVWRVPSPLPSPYTATIAQQVGSTFIDAVNNTDPNRCRTRKAWISDPTALDYHTYRSLGSECEQVWAFIEVPKDDYVSDPRCPEPDGPKCGFHSPRHGGTASFVSDVRGASSLVSAMTARGTKLYDPIRGVEVYDCERSAPVGPSDLAISPKIPPDPPGTIDPLCDARETDQYQTYFPDITTNGRFYSTLPIDDATLRSIARASNARTVTTSIGEAPNPACPNQCPVFDYAIDPATGKQYVDDEGNPIEGSPFYVAGPAVGTFFGPERHPELNGFSSDVSAGVVAIGKDASGSQLWLTITSPGLEQHTIWTDLNCITLDGGTRQCRPN